VSAILKKLRDRAVEKKGLYEFLNREVVPIVRELTNEVNRVGGDVSTVTAAYSILSTDRVVICAGGTAYDITLPFADDFENQWLLVKKSTAAAVNNRLLAQSGETIDGAANQTLTQNYGFMEIFCDGVSYHIVGSN
jgi:hypothetical protein